MVFVFVLLRLTGVGGVRGVAFTNLIFMGGRDLKRLRTSGLIFSFGAVLLSTFVQSLVFTFPHRFQDIFTTADIT